MATYLLPWPPSSPDMNPIEALWRLIKRRIANRHPCPRTMPDLYTAIHEKWHRLTSEKISNLTTSVPERVHDLILSSGSHTSW